MISDARLNEISQAFHDSLGEDLAQPPTKQAHIIFECSRNEAPKTRYLSDITIVNREDKRWDNIEENDGPFAHAFLPRAVIKDNMGLGNGIYAIPGLISVLKTQWTSPINCLVILWWYTAKVPKTIVPTVCLWLVMVVMSVVLFFFFRHAVKAVRSKKLLVRKERSAKLNECVEWMATSASMLSIFHWFAGFGGDATSWKWVGRFAALAAALRVVTHSIDKGDKSLKTTDIWTNIESFVCNDPKEKTKTETFSCWVLYSAIFFALCGAGFTSIWFFYKHQADVAKHFVGDEEETEKDGGETKPLTARQKANKSLARPNKSGFKPKGKKGFDTDDERVFVTNPTKNDKALIFGYEEFNPDKVTDISVEQAKLIKSKLLKEVEDYQDMDNEKAVSGGAFDARHIKYPVPAGWKWQPMYSDIIKNLNRYLRNKRTECVYNTDTTRWDYEVVPDEVVEESDSDDEEEDDGGDTPLDKILEALKGLGCRLDKLETTPVVVDNSKLPEAKGKERDEDPPKPSTSAPVVGQKLEEKKNTPETKEEKAVAQTTGVAPAPVRTDGRTKNQKRNDRRKAKESAKKAEVPLKKKQDVPDPSIAKEAKRRQESAKQVAVKKVNHECVHYQNCPMNLVTSAFDHCNRDCGGLQCTHWRDCAPVKEARKKTLATPPNNKFTPRVVDITSTETIKATMAYEKTTGEAAHANPPLKPAFHDARAISFLNSDGEHIVGGNIAMRNGERVAVTCLHWRDEKHKLVAVESTKHAVAHIDPNPIFVDEEGDYAIFAVKGDLPGVKALKPYVTNSTAFYTEMSGLDDEGERVYMSGYYDRRNGGEYHTRLGNSGEAMYENKQWIGNHFGNTTKETRAINFITPKVMAFLSGEV